MEAVVSQLLSDLRNSAVGTQVQTKLLSVVDSLEKFIASQEKMITLYHQKLADEQAARSQESASQLSRELKTITSALQKLQAEHLALQERYQLLLHHHFAKSSERWTDDDKSQALLFNEAELCAAQAEPEAPEPPIDTESSVPTKPSRKPRGKRALLPKTLERQDILVDIPEDQKTCASCGKPLSKIGEQISEKLEFIPAKFICKRTIRPKYGCNCPACSVVTAPVPAHIYPKSILGDTVLASIITSKFCDALPFYRLERILERSDIFISRQTMGRATMAVAQALAPLLMLFDLRLANCRVVCADETRLRVLKANGIKKESNSYMWVARGWDDQGTIVKFHYGGGRGAVVARELLGNFKGVLMCDAYAAYPAATVGTPIRLAACMAHVRRNFHDILKVNKHDPHAKTALAIIGGLYQVEREIADLDASQKHAERQVRSVPLFEQFRKWLFDRSEECAAQGALGKAVRYAMGVLDRLAVYLDDGEVPIDNNMAENTIRPFVVGRKNWMFSAEAEGAVASAAMYTLIETAKANKLEPMHYLLFLFRCYAKFGPEHMPWVDVQPQMDLREYAQKINIPWNFA